MSDSTDDNEIIGAISSPLELSDDEIASMSYEEVLAKYRDIPDDDEDQSEESDEEYKKDSTEDEPKDDSEEESTEEEDSNEESKEEEQSEEEESDSDDVDKDKDEDQTEDITELKQIKDKIFSEFKANGKSIKVDNVEQVISLMQMGANYTQKMTQIKSQLKTVQMLKAHGIEDESQLSFLIDIHKRNPAAIAKLIKDAELDPHNLDDTEANNYTGSNYSITDTQFEFKEVTEELRSDPSLKYNELMQTVGALDNRSKQTLLNEPYLLKDLSEHYKDGTYASVMAEVDRRKILGDRQLFGMSDLDAYVTVGRELAAKAAINTPANKPAAKAEVVATKVIAPKAKNNPNKKIAANVSGSGQGKAKEEINFLEMSDEEFEAFTKANKVLR